MCFPLKNDEIHVRTPEIPQPRPLGRGPWKLVQCGRTTREAPRPCVPSLGVARHKVAAPTAKGMLWEMGTKTVLWPPPGRTFQGTPQPWQWGPRFRGDMRWGITFNGPPHVHVLGTGSPAGCPGEALLWQQSEYPVGTGLRKGKEGASLVQTPRSSAGRPRKVSP